MALALHEELNTGGRASRAARRAGAADTGVSTRSKPVSGYRARLRNPTTTATPTGSGSSASDSEGDDEDDDEDAVGADEVAEFEAVSGSLGVLPPVMVCNSG